jgi:spore coat polysaccharide biosynthesis predicted glycosyltransferase SpsG
LKSKLFFRADGNEKIGLGHIVRCLSIIQMLGDRFECLLVVNNVNDKIKNLIKEVCDFVD